MMATAPPVAIDPSQLHLTIPTIPYPPPPPPLFAPAPAPAASNRSKTRALDILKFLVGLLIAFILAAILAVLVFIPRTSNEIDLRDSNEKLAKLERESNENIARLQREQEMYIEKERQKHQEDLIHQQYIIEMQRLERQNNLTEQQRLDDRLIEQILHEQDLQLAKEKLRQQLDIEQRRLELLLKEQLLAEERRKEDLNKENDDLLLNFMQDVSVATQPLNPSMFQYKVQSLIRRFDPSHKSLLINYLYKVKLLKAENPTDPILDLHGANLKEINLQETDTEFGQISPSLDYTQLALPSTNLINASFENFILNQANFSMSNMMGTNFRSAKVHQAHFDHSILSLSNFHYADAFQSHFSSAKIQGASFQNVHLSEAHMDYTDLSSSKFSNAIAIKTNFIRSEMSNVDFQYADLSQARMENISMRSGNFYFARAIQTNFSYAYIAISLFLWTDLTNASFRYATLVGTSFENANVQNVDFTGAFLAGVNITEGQLDVVLSIARAILPDGSRGKNKNLIKNGQATCTEMNNVILGWTTYENVLIIGNQFNSECVFQATNDNATLQQIIDIRFYERLIKDGEGKIYIEMEDKTTGSFNPSVYMIVRFYDSNKNEIDREKSTLDMTSFTPLPKFTATLPCPSNTVTVQVNIIFRQTNATVDNIYVTIE